MNEREVKARLAQAEVHYSHYRWDDAIACFEAVLAAHPDHPMATQGWANAVEQKNIDEELQQTLGKVRANLAAHRFEEALSALNLAQSRGALSQILKYHAEIDGLRSEAQEGQEWQRRVQAVTREAEALAGRLRFDQALEALDTLLHQLSARGWDQLGTGLASLRDRLWAERDVSERVQFARSTFEHQDYRLAAELAAALFEEFPEREDARRLHERARGAWGRVQDRLDTVEEALADDRRDDAIALLANLRSEHPHNPEWQAIWLHVHIDEGRQDVASGRSALVEHRFEDAADAFERAVAAFSASVEVFAGHPTAPAELAEARALREVAVLASQAVRDRAAFRWEPSHQGWQAGRDRLDEAAAVRGRDFGEVAAVVNAMLGEARGTLADLEHARLMLADGQQALAERDAGRARESFRAGLNRIDRVPTNDGSTSGAASAGALDVDTLKKRLAAGLREAERIQRDVKKLMDQAEAAKAGDRLRLLRRAYERWEMAPGLAGRLADALLTSATDNLKTGDEGAALALYEQVGELTAVPAAMAADAANMAAMLRSRQAVDAALAEATALMEESESGSVPSAEGYARALDVLSNARQHVEHAPDLEPRLDVVLRQAQERHGQARAAQRHLADSEALAASGEWSGAATALAAAHAAVGAPKEGELAARLAQYRALAAAVEGALAAGASALTRAEALYAASADGDLAAFRWDELRAALDDAVAALKPAGELPSVLPPTWKQAEFRVAALARRIEVLHTVREALEAGRTMEALSALQTYAASDGDRVVLAVLARLLEDTAEDATAYVRGRLIEAGAALGRGEVATAEALLSLLHRYAAAAPETAPELSRLERQTAALAGMRAATMEARSHAAHHEREAALACYRRGLELATDGDTGLPADARQVINLLFDLEDEVGADVGVGRHDALNKTTRAQGAALVVSLLGEISSQPLAVEFLAPALRGWWKLVCRKADLAFVEAQLILGHDVMACEAAARIVEARPRDPAAADLYRRAAGQLVDRLLSAARRGLNRARQLADRGAYPDALAELDRLEIDTLVPALPVVLRLERGAVVVEALEEATDLRRELQDLQALAVQLAPLQSEIREAALAGQHRDALSAHARAIFIDPQRNVAAIWSELDRLIALISERYAASAGPVQTPTEPFQQRTTRSSPGVEVQTPEAHPTKANPAEPRVFDPQVEAEQEEMADSQLLLTVEPARDLADEGNGAMHAGYGVSEAPANSAASEAPPSFDPDHPQIPFDLEDWLSNVTELSPEEGETENES